MRDADNIRAAVELGIEMIGFDFRPNSERFVRMISSSAGTIPDYSKERWNISPNKTAAARFKRVGVFADDMPQNIITRVYNYALDYVQLNGSESKIAIENLKQTLVPDIKADVKIIKAFTINTKQDFEAYKTYQGAADLLLFHFPTQQIAHGESPEEALLKNYNGNIPFLLSAAIAPEDAQRIKKFSHPQCVGIELNEAFEIAPARKDIEKLRRFINEIRS